MQSYRPLLSWVNSLFVHRSTAAAKVRDKGYSVRCITKRSKGARPPISPTKPCVVFAGKTPGVYDSWAETAPQVLGVRGSTYCQYDSAQGGRDAFDFALQRGWIRHCQQHAWVIIQQESNRVYPVGPYENPLNVGRIKARWYCVWRGLTPGVYGSL